MLMTGKQGQSTQVARTRSRTTTVASKKRKGSGTASIKAQLLRNIDTHHCTLSDANYNIVATHNTIYTANITGVITQGTTNASRIGDKIHLNDLVISMAVASAAAAGAYLWRVMVLWSGEEYNPTGIAAGLTQSEVFLPNSGTNLYALGITNPKAVTVLYDELVDINSLIAATKDVYSIRRTIHIGTDFQYQATGSIYGKTKNLYLVVCGTVLGGTLGVTGAGEAQFDCDLTFKPF